MTIKIFDLPYPQSSSKKEIIFSALGIAAVVYLFLVIFQPFGTYNYTHRFKYLLLTPYAVIAFILFTLAGFFPKRKATGWSLGKEIVKIMATLLACAVCSHWYNTRFITPVTFSLMGIVRMYLYSVAIGTPICTIFLLAKYIYTTKQISETAIIDTEIAPMPVPALNQVRLQATAGNDVLELSKDDFLFACAEGNYCNIFYMNNTKLSKYLIRLPLKLVEEQFSDARIVRCHRSFIVNLDKVIMAKGNAQGYKLFLRNITESIPVSRKYLSLALPFVQ